jgi:hypothetical protein
MKAAAKVFCYHRDCKKSYIKRRMDTMRRHIKRAHSITNKKAINKFLDDYAVKVEAAMKSSIASSNEEQKENNSSSEKSSPDMPSKTPHFKSRSKLIDVHLLS